MTGMYLKTEPFVVFFFTRWLTGVKTKVSCVSWTDDDDAHGDRNSQWSLPVRERDMNECEWT